MSLRNGKQASVARQEVGQCASWGSGPSFGEDSGPYPRLWRDRKSADAFWDSGLPQDRVPGEKSANVPLKSWSQFGCKQSTSGCRRYRESADMPLG